MPDCTLVTVTPCTTVPPRLSTLLAVRSGTDVLLGWDMEPLAAGGYHVYRTDLVQNLALPPAAGVLVASTIASPAANAASDLRAVEVASGPRLFYRAVAVCGDGSTEGP